MSKKSRTIKRARQELAKADQVTKARTPADVITLIPYVLGYEPADSIVIVSLVGPRRRFGPTMRMDLVPPASAAAQADYLRDVIDHHQFDSVVVVAFSADRAAADAVMRPLGAMLAKQGVELVQSLRADGSRWWSYACSDPACCDPDGTPYDSGAAAVAAHAVFTGMAKAGSRDDLRSHFDPADPGLCEAVDDAYAALLLSMTPADVESLTPDQVRGQVTAALGTDSLDADAIASLLLLIQIVRCRDIAWMMMTRATADEHLELWRRVTQAAPLDALPPAGSLAGFAAWIGGHGVLASHACDLVAAISPSYSMNKILREILDRTVNPEMWDKAEGRPFPVS